MKRRCFVHTSVAICGLTSGCSELTDTDRGWGSLTITNNSSLPQLVNVEPLQWPEDFPDEETKLTVSVYIESGESQYFEGYIPTDYTGFYELDARLDAADITPEFPLEMTVGTNEDGSIAGYAIEFSVREDGSMGWNKSSRTYEP